MTSRDIAEPPHEGLDPAWSERLSALASAADALGGLAASPCGSAGLAEAVVCLEVQARRLQALQSALVAQAVRVGLPASVGCKDGAGWLRSLVNLHPAQARLRADVGQTLLGPSRLGECLDEDLDSARKALLAGTITHEHAQVILDASDQLSPPAVPPDAIAPGVRTDALSFLAERAMGLDSRQLKTASVRLIAQLDPDGDSRLARDEERQAAHRGLTLSRMSTGLVHLAGTLTSDCAGLLATAIDAGSAPQPAADGSPDDRSAAMRRHDSLRDLLHQVVAADGMLPSTHGTAYRLVVTVPEKTVRDAMIGTPQAAAGQGTLPDGWPLSSTAVAALACSAELVPVIVDDVGNPLDVGDTQYVFPTRIRTAIATRDRHCTWPGCMAPPPWCDTHHLTPFSAGGATSVMNGGLLCGRHHRLVHAQGHVGHLRDGAVHWSLGPLQAPTDATSTVTDRLINHLARRNHQHLTRRRT